MNVHHRARALAAAVLLGVLATACVPHPAPQRTVTLSGHAYRFNQTSTDIVGAEIRIDELPELSATTDATGYWELEVPKGATVTPYIVAASYNTIYLQTFADVRADLTDLNFQTPHATTFAGLYQLLTYFGGGVAPDANGCVIVSTVSVPEVVGMPFDQFRTYNPHGIAGATASGVTAGGQAAPAPIYFDHTVTPNPTITSTSNDGGVVWVNVPEGVYTMSASHPDHEFETFVATCEQGRVINANPPQGLHALD